ncbi:MAG: heme-binding protein [Bacteroidota bacterium]
MTPRFTKQARTTLLIALLLVANHFIHAQSAADVPKLQLQDDITSVMATSVLTKAEELATAEKIVVNIAIVDAGANLKAFLRMDGSYLGSIDVAIKKAKTARYFNGSTKDLGTYTQPGGTLYGIERSNDGLISFPGGALITNKDGVIIGAIGISGGTIEQDHMIATEAAKSIL